MISRPARSTKRVLGQPDLLYRENPVLIHQKKKNDYQYTQRSNLILSIYSQYKGQQSSLINIMNKSYFHFHNLDVFKVQYN